MLCVSGNVLRPPIEIAVEIGHLESRLGCVVRSPHRFRGAGLLLGVRSWIRWLLSGPIPTDRGED
jgi:hypothetical protein